MSGALKLGFFSLAWFKGGGSTIERGGSAKITHALLGMFAELDLGSRYGLFCSCNCDKLCRLPRSYQRDEETSGRVASVCWSCRERQ